MKRPREGCCFWRTSRSLCSLRSGRSVRPKIQDGVFEQTFTSQKSYADPFNEVDVDVIFAQGWGNLARAYVLARRQPMDGSLRAAHFWRVHLSPGEYRQDESRAQLRKISLVGSQIRSRLSQATGCATSGCPREICKP